MPYEFVHHFLPHPHHKTRAKLLSHKALLGYTLLFGVFILALQVVPKLVPGVLGYASNIDIAALLAKTNQERQEAGQKSLVLNPALTRAAERKARHMFQNNYWAHVSPDGTQPWDFILRENYDYSHAGENLAKNFSNSDDVVDAWMRSPTHRDNLLSANYDEIGLAVVNGTLDGHETTLVVQLFGRPRNPSLIASTENQQVNSLITEAEASPIVQLVPDIVFTPTNVVNPIPGVPSVIDAHALTKTVTVVFGGFLISLLGLDIWYSQRKSIPKFTGHTLAHLAFLLLALVGVWFVFTPGLVGTGEEVTMGATSIGK